VEEGTLADASYSDPRRSTTSLCFLAPLVYRPRHHCLGVRRVRLTPVALRTGRHVIVAAFAARGSPMGLALRVATLRHFAPPLCFAVPAPQADRPRHQCRGVRRSAAHPAALVYLPRHPCLGVRRMRLTPASLRAGRHVTVPAFGAVRLTLRRISQRSGIERQDRAVAFTWGACRPVSKSFPRFLSRCGAARRTGSGKRGFRDERSSTAGGSRERAEGEPGEGAGRRAGELIKAGALARRPQAPVRDDLRSAYGTLERGVG